MAATPQPQPNDEQQEPVTTEGRVEAFKRKRLRMLALNDTELATPSSLGEILLPFLFAAAETCWVDAVFLGLASFGLFASHAPLMPLWTPFVLIAGTQWIVSRLERRAATAPAQNKRAIERATLPGSYWLILFITFVILLSIWLALYTQAAFFFDPRWLLAFLNDMLLLDVQAFHSAVIIALCFYFCWRGLRVIYREYEPSQAFSTLRLGMLILLAVILVRVGQISVGGIASGDLMLLLLIPIFFFLALSAHALARITFLRHTHTFDETNIEAQERAVVGVIAALGLALLLISLLTYALVSPQALEKARQALSLFGTLYDQLVLLVSELIVLLVTPLFLLINWLISLLPPRHAISNNAQRPRGLPSHVVSSGHLVSQLAPILKIALPLLFLLFAALIMRRLLHYLRRVRLIANQRGRETRESLWSWRLLWTPLQTLWRFLLRPFTRRRHTQRGMQAAPDDLPAAPSARTMREVYRLLLRRAAALGYARQRHETPSELKERLDAHLPASEPPLGQITAAYIETRYGAVVPDEAEAAHLRQAWGALQQVWDEKP
ncbi:MAG: DUF4129 domain-containing protein [Ktedonobacteraceae bacterium]